MVEIVTRDNSQLYKALLDDMHKMRYRVAVEQWGWKIPGIEPGYDKDDFDTEDTIYFLALNPAETRVVACARLNPTVKPHLLDTVFSSYCESTVPVGDDIFEMSRYIVDHRAMQKVDRDQVRARIPAAVNKFCLEAKIKQLTILSYMSSYARTVEIWKTRPLGLSKLSSDDGEEYIAAICDMDEPGFEKLKTKYGLESDEPYLKVRSNWSDHPVVKRLNSYSTRLEKVA